MTQRTRWLAGYYRSLNPRRCPCNTRDGPGRTAALRAVTLLSGAVASLPLKVYRRTPEGRELADDTEIYRLPHKEPNPM